MVSLEAHPIGNGPNSWTYLPPQSSTGTDPAFDLTRRSQSSANYLLPNPNESLSIKTIPILQPNGSHLQPNLYLDPTLSALIIIDMQNFFLSPALGRAASGPGHQAMAVLQDLIPRCEKAGIQIIWCNWGMSEQDLQELPPAVSKGFGALNAYTKREEPPNIEGEAIVDTKPSRIYKGFGTPMGSVTLDSGESIDAGRLLMRDQWNSSLPPPLLSLYESSISHRKKYHIWVHKNRMSGMWNDKTPLSQYLQGKGIRTLLFAGVNTDQCVQGTFVDAYNSGYDCLLVRDACGTETPGGKEVTEWNAGRSWGFVVDSEGVVRGIEAMLDAGEDRQGDGR